MNENLRLRVKVYIQKTRKVLEEIRIKRPFPVLNETLIDEVLDHIKRYAEDAEFYFEKKDFETALASISYCEGLLDALKLLKIADFEWPTIQS